MTTETHPARLPPRWRTALAALFAIALLNYLAQIPYYIHFYGVHHIAPAPLGIMLLALTLLLFLAGYVLTVQEKPIGGWLLLGFLVLDFGFYGVHNISGAFLHDVPTNDALFLSVSLVGYVNILVAFVYLIFILRDYKRFI